MTLSVFSNEPNLRDDLPRYPHLMQVLRVTGGTVPGPSGYMSSSVLGPSLHVAFTQQLRTDTILPRDREPCLVVDLNGYGLAPGYYTGRLTGSYQSLPVYAVGSAPISTAGMLSSFTGLTPTQQQQISTLTPAQFAVLNNLNPCQLQTLLTTLPISQVSTLSLSLTATELSNFVNWMTSSQLDSLYSQLTTSQTRVIAQTLNPVQLNPLVNVLTVPQIRTLITGLTTAQIQNLTKYPPATISALVNGLSTSDLSTLLSTSPLPTSPLTTGLIQTASFNSGTQNNVPVYGSILNVPTASATTITGIIPASTSSAQILTIANTGSSTLSIPHQNTGSDSGNRFQTSTSAALSIASGSAATFLYNPGTGYWTDTGVSAAMASGTPASSYPTWSSAISKSHTDLQTANTDNNIEIYSLPAKGVVHGVVMKTTTAFAGTGILTYTLQVGITGNTSKYISSAYDAMAAVSNTNFAVSDNGMSTPLPRPENFGAATSVRLRAVSAGANLDQSTAGAVDIYLLIGTLP